MNDATLAREVPETARPRAVRPAAALSMTMRSNLLTAIERTVQDWNVTQAEAARRLDITQPRLNDLLRGKLDKFSLDMLINLAVQAGLSVRMDITEAAGSPVLRR